MGKKFGEFLTRKGCSDDLIRKAFIVREADDAQLIRSLQAFEGNTLENIASMQINSSLKKPTSSPPPDNIRQEIEDFQDNKKKVDEGDGQPGQQRGVNKTSDFSIFGRRLSSFLQVMIPSIVEKVPTKAWIFWIPAALVIMIVGLWFFLSIGTPSGTKPSSTAEAFIWPEEEGVGVYPAIETSGALIWPPETLTATAQPIVQATALVVKQGISTELPMFTPEPTPSTLDTWLEKYDTAPWFMEEQEASEPRGPLFRLPINLIDMVTNTDWNWISFILIGVFVVLNMREERTREQQPHDWTLYIIGTCIFFFSLALDDEIALGLSQKVPWFIGSTADVKSDAIPLMGGLVAFGFYIAAAKSQRMDLTPLSVGLFTMGIILVALYPIPGIPRFVVGFILIILAIIIQLVELNNQEASASAIPLAVGGLGVFFAFRWLVNALLKLTVFVPPPTDSVTLYKAIQWGLALIFNNRLLISFVISAIVAYSLAGFIADLIFRPVFKAIEAEEGQLAGRYLPTEDTPRIDTVILFLMMLTAIWIAVGHP